MQPPTIPKPYLAKPLAQLCQDACQTGEGKTRLPMTSAECIDIILPDGVEGGSSIMVAPQGSLKPHGTYLLNQGHICN